MHLIEKFYFESVNHSKFQHITDKELLDRFYIDRNNEWLGILLQRYTLLLLGTCMKYLKNEEAAKDAVQQIFLKAIAELQKYKVDYFKSWIYMVTKNHCLMQLRNKNVFMEVTDITDETRDEDWKLDELKQSQLADLLQSSLSLLNEEQKTCVTLFYLHKKTYADIADTTGFSVLQVKSYIQNGKRNLRLMIEKQMKHLK